jgi:hypothetical protein
MIEETEQPVERRESFEMTEFTFRDYCDFAVPFCRKHNYSMSAHLAPSGIGKATFTPIVITCPKVIAGPLIFSVANMPQIIL